MLEGHASYSNNRDMVGFYGTADTLGKTGNEQLFRDPFHEDDALREQHVGFCRIQVPFNVVAGRFASGTLAEDAGGIGDVDAPIGFGEAEADDGFKPRGSRDVRRMGRKEYLPTGLLRGEPLLDVLE